MHVHKLSHSIVHPLYSDGQRWEIDGNLTLLKIKKSIAYCRSHNIEYRIKM